jgi:hypothetical protein
MLVDKTFMPNGAHLNITTPACSQKKKIKRILFMHLYQSQNGRQIRSCSALVNTGRIKCSDVALRHSLELDHYFMICTYLYISYEHVKTVLALEPGHISVTKVIMNQSLTATQSRLIRQCPNKSCLSSETGSSGQNRTTHHTVSVFDFPWLSPADTASRSASISTVVFIYKWKHQTIRERPVTSVSVGGWGKG